ncbi:thioredoxin family protein [Pontibacter qinzhouensis]|uniref:Thioredoxin family protein n=1 Tax=Pontibacter qinzhouensis TaxID=2603253 RepID=A0A5C8K7T4_9BACT|nr:thioredoxin family protein [Pontibacter qinzhouensis]TXK48997.1 thioredoxin family protein [Pontibacter qinzhouensis]
MKKLASIAVALLLAGSVFAQSGSYKLNDKVANFSLQDGKNKTVSLTDFAGKRAVVVVFTNNNCPYSKLYEERLVNLAGTYGSKGIQFVFVNPSVGTGEASETLQELAAKNYSFPYLADQEQSLSGKFGATKTPEAFVLLQTDGQFTLKYKGAIDDNPQVADQVKNFFLKNVIEEVLSNKTVTSLERRATGCLIKKY